MANLDKNLRHIKKTDEQRARESRYLQAKDAKLRKDQLKIIDITHEEKINALIPQAWAVANRKTNKLPDEKRHEYIGGADGKHFRACMRTRFYFQEMNRLAVDEGLRIV